MRKAEALHYRGVIEQAAQFLPDETALQAVTLHPMWASGVSYAVGFKAQHGGTLYRCLTTHTSQDTWTPEAAPSLWAKVLIPDENVIPAWEQPDSTNYYNKGDKVTHNGKVWISTIDVNTYEPGVYGWEVTD